MATAIADAAGRARDYLDETGGRYVHVLADGWASACRWRPRSPTLPAARATTSTRRAAATCTCWPTAARRLSPGAAGRPRWIQGDRKLGACRRVRRVARVGFRAIASSALVAGCGGSPALDSGRSQARRLSPGAAGRALGWDRCCRPKRRRGQASFYVLLPDRVPKRSSSQPGARVGSVLQAQTPAGAGQLLCAAARPGAEKINAVGRRRGAARPR